MKRKGPFFGLTLFTLFLTTQAVHGDPGATPSCLLKIAEPHEGQQVGRSAIVRGTATLPAGDHLWVFARRESFQDQDVWWPQAEGRVDSKTGEWKVSASLGEPRDIGWSFDIAVAVFKEDESLELKSHVREAMKTGNWLPIEMPASVCPPEFRKVKKSSHN